MISQSIKELKKNIDYLSYKISKLSSKADESATVGKIYNQMLIERACAREKLKQLKSSNKGILGFLSSQFKRRSKEKLISDYFKTGVV